MGASRLASAALELHVFVGSGPRVTSDEPDARLLHSRPQTGQAGVQPDWRDDRLVVHQLLDAIQRRLAPLRIDLVRLLLEEAVDVGVATVNIAAAPGDECLDSRRGIAESAAGAVDAPFVLLFGPALPARRPPG